MDELNGDSDEKQESSPLSATNEDGTMSESPGCSGQAINGSPSHSSNRNRRKARPKKVIIEENENTQENNWLGEDCSEEPPMAAESMHSAEPIPTSSGLSSFSNQIPTEQLLKSFTDALAGKVDVQMLLNQMIAGASTSSLPPEAMGLSSSSNFISNLDTDDACTSSTESDLHSVSQQMMSAVAQQQLAALTAVASMTPVTPNSSSSPLSSTPSKGSIAQFGSLDSLSSSSTSRQLGGTQQKPQKRKLFDASRQPSQSSLRGDQMTRDERIEIEDLEQFAAMFKKQRIKFGFTQGDVGQALGRRYGTDFSQTTISRFEAMNLSFKNMCKLRPLLKEWLSDAERALANGASLTELIDNHTGSVQEKLESLMKQEEGECSQLSTPQITPPATHSTPQSSSGSANTPLKKRRKRTNLDLQQRQVLDIVFKMNPRPSHEHMAELADQLKLERDVVRVWFCNRRQKMRKVDDVTSPSQLDPAVLQSMLFGGQSGCLSPKRETSDSPALSTASKDQ